MQTKISIFATETPGSFGYSVESDAGHRIIQESAPGASGFVEMSYDEAEAFAQADVLRITAAAPEPEPTGEPA